MEKKGNAEMENNGVRTGVYFISIMVARNTLLERFKLRSKEKVGNTGYNMTGGRVSKPKEQNSPES